MMAIRVKLLLTIWLIISVIAGASAWLLYDLHKKEYLAGIDKQLLTAAYMARATLPSDYHDRIVDKASVSSTDYLEIVDRYNKICQKTGLQYLWSNLMLEDRIVFTSGTSTSKDVANGDHALFFDPHTDPSAFAKVIDSEKTEFLSFRNKWGGGRMVLVPDRDAKGRLFVFGASIPTDQVNANLEHGVFIGGIIFLGALLFSTVTGYPIAKSFSDSLREVMAASVRIANDDFSRPIGTLEGQEMKALSLSLNRMSDAVRSRRDHLHHLIEERKCAEETLAESEQRFRNLVESTSDWVWEIDDKYRYIYSSPKVKDNLGFDPAYVVGRSPFDLMTAESAGKVKQEFAPIAEARVPFSGLVNVCRHKNGHDVVMETSGIPIFDKNGKFSGYRGIDRNITDRQKAEEQLRAAHDELEAKVEERTQKLSQEIIEHEQTETKLIEAMEVVERASQAKSDFLSSMSHELRTPLNAILGFGQVLSRENQTHLSEAERDMAVDFILKGGRHLLDLIDQVLELNKIESGRMAISIGSISPQPVIRDCLSFVHTRAVEENVKVIDETINVPLPMLLADSTRLGQVLLNLLSNAIKYNRKGGTLTLSSELLPDQMLRILVADTGVGIPKDRQNDLFTPFERLGRESGHIEGTGIGLSITKKIVEGMGGAHRL